MNRHAEFRRKARNYAFRELRKRASLVESLITLAPASNNARMFEANANHIAESARKLACEYSAFIAKGSYC